MKSDENIERTNMRSLLFLLIGVFALEAEEIVVKQTKLLPTLQIYKYEWNTTPGSTYDVFTSTNALSWQQYGNAIVASSNSAFVVINDVISKPQYRFLYVRDISIRGDLVIDENINVVGTSTIPFGVTVLGANPQYVEIQNVVHGKTNVLKCFDFLNSPTDQFLFDSSLVQSGTSNMFQLLIVDDYGNKKTSEEIRFGYSRSKLVSPANPISTPGFSGEVGWRFYLEFSTIYSEGIWQANAFSDDGSNNFVWSGVIEEDKDEKGIITVSDQNAVFSGYSGSNFTIDINVYVPGVITNQLSRQAHIAKRPSSMEFISVQELDIFEDGVHAGLETMLGVAMGNMNRLGDMFSLDNTNRVVAPLEWNVMDTELMWRNLPRYLRGEFGRSPSHFYFFGNGGPVFLGDVNSARNITLAEIGAVTNKLTFAFFDGFDYPIGLVKRLVDERKRTRQELLDKGLYPRFALFWKTNPFSLGRSADDIGAEHELFVKRFFNAAFELNDFSRLPFRTYGESLAIASMTETNTLNPISLHIDWVGCDELFADEVIISDIPQ